MYKGEKGGGGASVFLLSLRETLCQKILLPLARDLEEGRGTTIFKLPRLKLHKQVVPQPPWEPPTPQHPNRVKNT